MTLQDYLNIFGTIGLITTGSLVGSLITILIQHFLDKGRLKTERQSNLQKEIYFNLQKQAEKFLFHANLINAQAEEIKFWLQSQIFNKDLPNISKEEKLKDMAVILVYFPKDISIKYDNVAKVFRKVLDIYFDVGKTGEITNAQSTDLQTIYPDLMSNLNDLKKLILSDLDQKRKEIL